MICSGDPDSLDGVLIPAWHVGYADGTSPHILDVALPAASGAYLDLGQFYDVAALRPKREVLADLTAKYRAQYAIAYKALAEAKRLHDDLKPSTIRMSILTGFTRWQRSIFYACKRKIDIVNASKMV
ncbi:MAG: hypothetical protein ACLR8U_11460 [Oscillospiraceae bacterium]